MEERSRARQAVNPSKRRTSTEVDPGDECDPEANAKDEVSDGEALRPDTATREKASGPDRQVKSTRKPRQERNMVLKKSRSK